MEDIHCSYIVRGDLFEYSSRAYSGYEPVSNNVQRSRASSAVNDEVRRKLTGHLDVYTTDTTDWWPPINVH